MRFLSVKVYHRKDGEACFRQFYFTTFNQGEELQDELHRTFVNLGVEELITYTVKELAKVPVTSVSLAIG